MKLALCLTACLVAGGALAEPIPPYHLSAQLQPGGSVQLAWEPGPVDGLQEDFEDGVAQDFQWHLPCPDGYPTPAYFAIENGYMEMFPDNNNGRIASAVYEGISFGDFSYKVAIENTDLAGQTFRGIVFRANGVWDEDFSGYYFFYTVLWDNQYLVRKYENGHQVAVLINYTTSDALLEGPDDINLLKVTGKDNQFKFYINDVLVDSVEDDTHSRGYVGAALFPYVASRFHSMTCRHGVGQSPPDGDPVEYRVYRDGVLLGSTASLSFSDQLPDYGEYSYEVTAVFDPEGESIPSPVAAVEWNPVTYSLAGVSTVVPASGGTITFSGTLFNETPQAIPGLMFRTYALLPDQTVYGPLVQRNFCLWPGMHLYLPSMEQQIPSGMPPGEFLFTGQFWREGEPVLEQSFPFYKMGGE